MRTDFSLSFSLHPSPRRTARRAAATDASNEATAREDFQAILRGLRKSIARERRTARRATIAAAVVSTAALAALFLIGQNGLEVIKMAPGGAKTTAVTVYLLVRGTAFAAVLSGIVFTVITLARSALDQATRFDKRLIAARFIDYAVHSPGVDVEKMEVALRVLEAWGASVESAYTPSRVAAKRPESVKFAIGRDGLAVESSSGPHD